MTNREPYRIHDIQDPRVAVFANLRKRSLVRDSEHFVAEGRWVVERLLHSDYPIAAILVQQGLEDYYLEAVPAETPVYSLPKDQVAKLVGFDFHRGVLACGIRPRPQPSEVFATKTAHPRLSLALINVTEPENVGSILRSAAAFGIDQVLVDRRSADPFCRRVVRVSMATVLKQQFYQLLDPPAELARMNRVRTLAATLETTATPLESFRSDDRPMLLLVGNEAYGLEPQVQGIASDRITIPMKLGTDSLNVAIATAIFMHHLSSK